MRRLCTLIFSLLVLCTLTMPVAAQVELPLAAERITTRPNDAICGAPFMREQEQQALAALTRHPEWREAGRLQKTAWNFTVGSQKSWYAHDFRSNQRYLVPSTCRAVGTNCYIFVEDALWRDTVTQTAVDAFQTAYNTKTPANATKGSYQSNVEVFGAPPNVDGDAKIIILILDIKDSFTDAGSGGFIGGYFTGYNELPVTVAPQSNVAEILFIDANPLDLNSTTGLEFGLSTLAHEFQHMIHYNYDNNEITFINEACSEVASVIAGYPISDQSYYVTETNINLLSWQAEIGDYARAARFMTYMRDQVGVGFFKSLVQSPSDGAFGIDAALQAIGSTLRFSDIFNNFVIANILDDKTVNPAYGYTYPNLPKVQGRLLANPNVTTTNSNVELLAAEYLSFKFGANLRVKFTVANPSVVIKAVEIGAASKRVLDVTPNVDFVEPDYGSTYSEIHFVVTNTSQAFSYGYSYQASGTAQAVELKWDQGEPLGAFQVTPNDTVCVAFDALAGGRLDSIRVAPRQAGTYTGGIWQFTGVTRPTPLGKRLVFPITATLGVTPQRPFPVPYPREYWSKIDLQSLNISTDRPFAVGFVVGANALTLVVTEGPFQSPFTQFTYLQNPSSGSANWYIITTTETTMGIYLVRAYVSFPTTTGVRRTVELAPSTFFLAQNYPNPFNPSTTIEFSLPKASQVTLKIFNALGEEVATLLQEKRAAGKYSVAWNAANLPSGIYMYRLEGEGFVETKRLVLMK
ncbi:MAG: hypothetical protein ALAOOOJD_03641 [bacterium]|nr:hypothetical protein [bacterium]